MSVWDIQTTGSPATAAPRADAAADPALAQLHQDLLRLRRRDPVIAAQAREAVDGAVLGAAAFALRWFGGAGDDRLLRQAIEHFDPGAHAVAGDRLEAVDLRQLEPACVRATTPRRPAGER